MLRSITVKSCMATSVVTFKPSDTVYDALDQILEYKFSGAPVVNEKNELLGMFSESDCLRAILKMTYHEEEAELLVSDFMAKTIDSIHEETGLVDVASKFIKDGRRRLPVVNDEGLLVGQVSRRDILRAVRNYHAETAN